MLFNVARGRRLIEGISWCRRRNLQRLSTPDGPAVEETIFEGHDISFFDDLEALPSLFQTTNHETSGELLIDFFRYFSKDFNYAHSVVSIRSDKGVLPKVQKGWHTDFEFDPELTVRDQHKLCIEVSFPPAPAVFLSSTHRHPTEPNDEDRAGPFPIRLQCRSDGDEGRTVYCESFLVFSHVSFL